MDRHYQLTDITFEYEGTGADLHAVTLVARQTINGPPIEVVTVKIPFAIFDQLAIAVADERIPATVVDGDSDSPAVGAS